MKFIHIILGCMLTAGWVHGADQLSQHQGLQQINQFHFASNQLASSATPDLHQYQILKEAGFKHIIVLSAGLHLVEKTHAEALGMTFEQVNVTLNEPAELNFNEFSELLVGYGDEPVYVFSEQNWRAATYVYRYQALLKEDLLLAAK